MNGVVYAAFGSDCDTPALAGLGVRRLDRGAGQGALGRGAERQRRGHLAVRRGHHLRRSRHAAVSTGNAGSPSVPTPGKTPPASLAESVIRLNVQPDGSLKAADFFAPFDAQQLD